MRVIVTLAALLVATGAASAAEIKALITTAMEAAIVELVPPFERATGHKVTVSYDPSGGLRPAAAQRRVRRHDPDRQRPSSTS